MNEGYFVAIAVLESERVYVLDDGEHEGDFGRGHLGFQPSESPQPHVAHLQVLIGALDLMHQVVETRLAHLPCVYFWAVRSVHDLLVALSI